MSVQASDARIPQFCWVAKSAIPVIVNQTGPYGLALFMVLAMHANSSRDCWPSIATMAEAAGMSPRKVRLTLRELEAAGIISTEHRRTAKDAPATSVYTLIDDVRGTAQGAGAAQGAVGGAACGAVGVRHDMPKGTARGAAKLEEVNKNQKNKTTSTSKATPRPPTLQAAKPADQDATRRAPARATGKASRPVAERPRDPAFDAFMGAFPTAAASLAAKFSRLVKGKAAPGDWDAWLRDVREDRAKGYVKAHNACELFLAWLDTRRGSPVTGSELEARMLRLGAPDNWRDIVYAPGGVRRSPVLALPRLGLEPYAPPSEWPTWYQQFEGVQS